jgi:hypothetical protein
MVSLRQVSDVLALVFLSGLTNWLQATVPTWQSECSKAHRRGMLVMVEGALISGGVSRSYYSLADAI